MSDPLAWWRDALAGHKPRITHEPECGYYRRRLVRGGPWVPVAIWYGDPPKDEDGTTLGDAPLLCAVNGKLTDPHETWTWVATEPITEEAYKALVNEAKTRQLGTLPAATEKHDLLTVAFPTFKRRD
jgi:hypothetical protein